VTTTKTEELARTERVPEPSMLLLLLPAIGLLGFKRRK